MAEIKCKQCGKSKPVTDFPWIKSNVCRDCHIYNAMHWDEIPWPKAERKMSLSDEERKRRSDRRKELNKLRRKA